MEETGELKRNQFDWVFLFRLFFTILGWTTIAIGQVRRYTNPYYASLPWWELIFGSYRYFTMQTNFIALTWLSLSLIWYNKPELMKKMNGWLRGAINSYVTGMMILFALLLSYDYQPEGFALFSNYLSFSTVHSNPVGICFSALTNRPFYFLVYSILLH